MSSEYMDATLTQIHDLISRLQQPIPTLPDLLSLLSPPLSYLSLLPSRFVSYNSTPLSRNSLVVSKHVPLLQRSLLEHVIPKWWDLLEEEGYLEMIEAYFFPDGEGANMNVREVVVYAYSTILSCPLNEYSIRMLLGLVKKYPIDKLHSVVFSGPVTGIGKGSERDRKNIMWEECVRNVVAVPVKVANAVMGGGMRDIADELEYGRYFSDMCVRCDELIAGLSAGGLRKDNLTSITYLLAKLITLGVFPPSPPSSPSQPSFFYTVLPAIRRRLHLQQHDAKEHEYSTAWQTLLSSLPTSHNLRTLFTSLLSHLNLSLPPPHQSSSSFPGLDPSSQSRAHIKQEAQIVRGIVGRLSGKDKDEVWESVGAVVLGREWGDVGARIIVCWIGGAGDGEVDVRALEMFLQKVVEIWTSPEHIKHSLLSFHRYITVLLLITLSYLPSPSTSFPPSSTPIHTSELAFSPSFIRSVSQYITHLDSSVRLCGMLVAEAVAARVGKKVGFELDEENGWVGAVQEVLKGRDWDLDAKLTETTTTKEREVAENEEEEAAASTRQISSLSLPPPPRPPTPDSDDDSLLSYASPPSPSRTPSPTPSALSELERDPTLLVNNKPVLRPVYLLQLGEMLRGGKGKGLGGIGMSGGINGAEGDGTSGETWEEVKRVEVALDVAEEMIRKRRGFGGELEENAVNLAYALVGLQDNYDLEGFNVKRQAALNALVACCPRNAAPAIIEEFFKNQYSTDQRFVMLNALALGARELASLPIPASAAVQPLTGDRVSFPSKKLPPALHRKYLTIGGQNTIDDNPVQKLLMDISRDAVDKTKEASADKVPELVRERRLRVRQPAKVTEVIPLSKTTATAPSRTALQSTQTQTTTFTEVAAGFFVCPLINRFWLFLRDEQAREERTSYHQERIYQYRGAGTGLILSPMVLSHFLSTVAVFVHAARNAKEWLAVIAPDALELAVTLGTRPMSKLEDEDENGVSVGDASNVEGEVKGKEAAVLTAALELSLVVLDGCLDLDGGRSLGLEHTALLLGTGEWAGKVFALLEKGLKVEGGGGMQEVRLRRAAAGVLLKVDELSSKWKRSMISL